MLQARLSHIALRAEDVGLTQRFYEEILGLGNTSSQVATRMNLGRGLHVLQLGRGEGLDHYALEVTDDAQYAALLGRLEKAGIEVEEMSADDTHPACIRFSDPEDHLVEVHRSAGMLGEHVMGRRPVRLHHITLSAEDVPSLVAFYTDVLGFRISDRMGEHFQWLRCNREHHTVAVVQGPRGGLDHYCYEVNNWEELKTWCDELAARNVTITWGPGRHGPGNNLFIFFDDPDGVRIELSCEIERFYDDYIEYPGERVWSSAAGALNLWGPGPDWRSEFARDDSSAAVETA